MRVLNALYQDAIRLGDTAGLPTQPQYLMAGIHENEYINSTPGPELSIGQSVKLPDNVTIDVLWYQQKLDLAAFMLNKDKCIGISTDFVFYGNQTGTNGSIRHSGDDEDGFTKGESITLILSKIPLRVESILVMITADDNMFEYNADITLTSNEKELFRYKVRTEHASKTLVIGIMQRQSDGWSYKLANNAKQLNLKQLCSMFGVKIV